MRKVKILAMILLLFASFYVAPGQAVKSRAYSAMLRTLLHHSVPETTVADAARDSADILFLDAREPREYVVSHIPGAVAVGYDSFEVKNLPSALAKDRRIVVYCSVGYRSEKVTEKLRAAGFTQVSNLYGGIFEWVNQGHIVRDEEGPTERVHAYGKAWGIWLRKGKKVYK